eukprot:TRINITY_DN12560_c0_g2_i1.p1 TRINITY_DN12560_c0_g2~~TRINITY_DN12560_c0_g2_i1.p1  ORF type:complete len:1100 (+),score=322.27 TRINITY_DN12560_c0_g2_i1:139-3438(+)
MRPGDFRDEVLKRFSSIHKDQLFGQHDAASNLFDKNFPSALPDQFPSRAISAGSHNEDATLNKQTLHAAVRDSLFSNMKPLKEQLEERGSQPIDKAHMNERERRLMLRELERKKRFAGIDDSSAYGAVERVAQENGKENTAAENIAKPQINTEWKRAEEVPKVQYQMDLFQDKEIPVLSAAVKNPVEPKSEPIIPIGESKKEVPVSIFNQAYEREQQRKERVRETLKSDYLKAQAKSSQRQRRSEASSEGTGLPLGAPDAAEEKRKKQLQYRQELESQLRAKQNNPFAPISKRAESSTSKSTQKLVERNNDIDEESLQRKLKKEAYAKELEQQIEFKKRQSGLKNAMKIGSRVDTVDNSMQDPKVLYRADQGVRRSDSNQEAICRANAAEAYRVDLPPKQSPPLAAPYKMYKPEARPLYRNEIPQYKVDQEQIHRPEPTQIFRQNSIPAYNPEPQPIYPPEPVGGYKADIFRADPLYPPQHIPLPMHRMNSIPAEAVSSYGQDPMQMYRNEPATVYRENLAGRELSSGGYQREGCGEDAKTASKQKMEDYRKCLELQINEQKEKKEKAAESMPPQILKHVDKLASEVEAERQKKLKAQQLMQEELKRQIEEKERKKASEERRKKLEDEKDMERLKREQEEVKRKMKQEVEDTRVVGVSNPAEHKKKQFEPSADNPMSKASPFGDFPEPKVQEAPKRRPIAEEVKAEMPVTEKNIFSQEDIFQPQRNLPERSQLFRAIEEPSEQPRPEFVPQNPLANIYPEQPAFNPPFSAEAEKPVFRLDPEQSMSKSPIERREDKLNLLDQYQRQLEKEKAENLQAKEQALMYKEQLIRERELRVQQMMDRMSQGLSVQQPSEIIQELPQNVFGERFEPGTEELSLESGTHKQDDTAYMTQLMKSELKMQNPPAANFDLEESLSSDTKLVKVAERPDALKDLYQTWTTEKVQEARNKYADASLQTSVEGCEVVGLKESHAKPVEVIPERKAAGEEEIEEDYSQVEQQTIVDFDKHCSSKKEKVVSPRASGSVKITDLKVARMNRAKNSTKSAATKMIEALQRDIAGISQANKQNAKVSSAQEQERRKWTDSTGSKIDGSINENEDKDN